MATIGGQNGSIPPYTSFSLSPRQLAQLAWYAQQHPLIRDLHTHIYLTGVLTRDGSLCWYWRPPFSAYRAYPPFLGVGHFNIYGSQAVKDVQASHETLLDIFGRVEMFFRRLEMYTEVPLTTEMMEVIIEIMAEVLSVVGIATKEIKQGRTSE